MPMRITRDEAAALAVIAQGLDDAIERPVTKERLIQLICRIGCLQIDTISVVARSHYLVLWSRVGQYDMGLLDELHHPDRRLFEYWAHAASLIPAELFPYFRRRMQIRASDHLETDASWAIENQVLLDEVLEAVRQHGPISSNHFDRPNPDEPVAAWSWWGGKPANRALDVLWSIGSLSVHRRVNFQRHYELTERLFPEHVEADLPCQAEEERVLATRAVEAMGIGFPQGINDYFRTKWGARTRPLLRELEEDGIIFSVEVEDLGSAYVAECSRPLLEEVHAGRRPKRTTLLSPFDNLIWERHRTEKLFDFEYRLECYTPAPKRKYGYFTLPILDRGKLIGRIDPKVDRREKILYLRSIHIEDGVKLGSQRTARITRILRDFARFNEATTVVVQSGPGEIEPRFEA